MDKLKPCPACGGEAKIQICDSEGNIRRPEYVQNPWSGLGYRLYHDIKDAIGDCPIAGDAEAGDFLSGWIYETKEDAADDWNQRIAEKCEPVKHGQWSEKMVSYKDTQGNLHAGFQCSECQGIFNKTKFCGGCGALMDKTKGG